MKLKNILSLAIFIFTILASCAFGDTDTWHDPSYNLANLRKIFILPINTADLKSGRENSVMPKRQRQAEINKWAVSAAHNGIKSLNKKTLPIVKTFNDILDDMKFISGAPDVDYENFWNSSRSARAEFFKKASEMGYQAALNLELTQKIVTEHVPEKTRTYTEYKEVEVYDKHHRHVETIRIPEEKTEVIPAHDVDYLSTECLAQLYDVNSPENHYGEDHRAAVKYSIYREYEGGSVMKVVENVIRASIKNLFERK